MDVLFKYFHSSFHSGTKNKHPEIPGKNNSRQGNKTVRIANSVLGRVISHGFDVTGGQ